MHALHASWIVDLYEHLKKEMGMIIKCFDSAGITEAVNNAQSIYEKIENPYRSLLTLLFNKEKKRKVS